MCTVMLAARSMKNCEIEIFCDEFSELSNYILYALLLYYMFVFTQ
jgi:hypothetical protein